MKTTLDTLSTIRVYAAIGIMAVALIVIASIVIIDTVRDEMLPAYVTTVAGFLLGFATHELGLFKGVTLALPSQPEANVTQQTDQLQQVKPPFDQPGEGMGLPNA